MNKIFVTVGMLFAIAGWSQTITLVSPTPLYWGMDSMRINIAPESIITFQVSEFPSVLFASDDSTFTVRKPLGDLSGQKDIIYTLRRTYEGKPVLRYTSQKPSQATAVKPTQLPWSFLASWDPAPLPKDSIAPVEVDSAFEVLLAEVQAKEREFERLQLSKNYIVEHKVSTANARRLLDNLGFENTRFELLMLIVEHCKDPENLSDLSDELSFEPTKNSYLERVKERASPHLEP